MKNSLWQTRLWYYRQGPDERYNELKFITDIGHDCEKRL